MRGRLVENLGHDQIFAADVSAAIISDPAVVPTDCAVGRLWNARRLNPAGAQSWR